MESENGLQEDFTDNNETYDAIFSVVGKTRFSHCKNLLKPKGIYLENALELQDVISMLWTSITGGRKIKGGVASENAENTRFFKELIEAGKLRSVIDRSYPLEQIVDAFKYVEKGHKKGNVVITVAPEQ